MIINDEYNYNYDAYSPRACSLEFAWRSSYKKCVFWIKPQFLMKGHHSWLHIGKELVEKI